MKHKNLMAKALYDNVPESPEELAFRKGDILTVIEQNTGGLEGWWLCSLHGRQGIAPGNRLKLLIGLAFEAQPSPASVPSPQSYQQNPGPYQNQQDIYQIPPRSAVAAENTPSKVVTPTRVGQSYTFSPGQQNQQSIYDVPPSRTQGVYDVPPGQMFSGQGGARNQGVYDIPPSQMDLRTQGVYDVPPSQMDLRTQGVYDVPPSQMDLRTQGVYDVPPSSQGVYSVPPCRTTPTPQEGTYDFPQPLKLKQEGIYDVPPPVLSRLAQCLYDVPPPGAEPPAQRQQPISSEGIYDVPPPAPQTGPDPQDLYDFPRGAAPQHRGEGVYDVTDGVNRLSVSSTGSSRSSMSTSSSSAGSGSPLDLEAALQRLQHLQQALELTVGALHAMAASPHWRTFPFMERNANSARSMLDRVRTALGDFVAFGRGAAANATSLSDPGLHAKLRRQLGRLEDSQQILLQTYQNLDACGWALNVLTRPRQHHNKSDDLDRFVMVSRTVPDDAKQLTATINASADLLFRRIDGSTPEDNPAHPLATPPPENDNYRGLTKTFPGSTGSTGSTGPDKDNMNNSEKCVKSWMEDYDYVHLQGKEDFERQQKELLEKENIIKQNQVQLGQEQINQFKKLEQEVIKPVENDVTQWISAAPSDPSSAQVCARDRQLLAFYSAQCEQHFVTLLGAVDAFFGCVRAGQPPRIFVAHSKFVILSAHKLVFIGDTLSRQAAAPELANGVMNASNVLCDLLKTVVGATKMAALNYPNTAAVQEMVDRVTDLSHHARQFKEQLLQMSSP